MPAPAPAPLHAFGASRQPGVCRMLVYADFRSGAPGFHAALAELGEYETLGPGLFVLRTALSLGEVRTRLGHVTHRGDRLFVLDTQRDRYACLDLGPETEARLRRIWRP